MRRWLLNLLDRTRGLHRSVPESVARAVIAGLTAEPETIEELERGTARFLRPLPGKRMFGAWSDGSSTHGDNVCLVDLGGRVVLWSGPGEGTFARQGCIADGPNAQDAQSRIWFQLSDDWEFFPYVGGWPELVAAARARRDAACRIPARRVLYEGVVEYIVTRTLAAAPVLRARGAKLADTQVARTIRALHRCWLQTRLPELGGRSPRDVLLEKRAFIDGDLGSRRDQWILTGRCPPGLPRGAHAYRHAGFGTHEILTYHHLVRTLLSTCWKEALSTRDIDPAREATRLRDARDRWLRRPCAELTDRWTPAQVIHRERARLPLALVGRAATIDCDCPLCQMMVDTGPLFVDLDGRNVDDEFVYSTHATEAEWRAERQKTWQESLDARLTAELRDPTAPDDVHRSASPEQADERSLELQLFSFGTSLADLTAELRQDARTAAHVTTLHGYFRIVRDLIGEPAPLPLEPTIERFCAALLDIAADAPVHAARCRTLQQALNRFLEAVVSLP